MKRGRAVLSLFLVLTVVTSVFAGAGSVAANPTDDLNYGEDGADPVFIDVDTLTVAQHPMSEGASDSDMAGYYNDSAEWVSDPPFVVNTSIGENTESDELGNRNPYTFNPAHIDADTYDAFPRVGSNEDDPDTDDSASEDNLASALDASEWTASGKNSGEVTISDTTVASNVDAVRFDTGTSMTGGDIAGGKYSNWTDELDSDESKRVVQLAGDIDTLDPGTTVYINITDEDGDYKRLLIDPDAASQDANKSVVATSTGSFVYQIKLSLITTQGSGTWDNIEEINITAHDGDFDGSFSWIDLESKGKDTLGEKVLDDDDDDDDFDDTESIYNATGTIDVHSMTTLDTVFDDATVTDVQFPAKFRVQDLTTEGDDEDYRVTWTTSTKYDQPNVLTAEYRLVLPDAIDLSYSGTDLEMEQSWPEGRYIEVGLYEDADGKNFSDVDEDDDYTSQLSSLGTEDERVTLDSTVSSGTEYVLMIKSVFSDAEKSNDIEASMADDTDDTVAGGGVGGQEQQGFIGSTMSWVLGILTAGAALLFRVPQKILGVFSG